MSQISDIDRHNQIVARHGFKIRAMLKVSISRLTMKGKYKLIRSLRLRFKKEYGEISQLKYEFSRHGVFFHKGVGRGYIMQGSRVIRGTRQAGSTIQTSGPLLRKPKDWFNPVLSKEVPRLADDIAEVQADNAATKIIKIR
ncbi:MAG: hypothetical protein HN352_16885 [Bacteroidetes bacterium]|jgi:hypothetical protein|nr:hypothetical protein [Bacteroidota bacterium]MBT4410414.1 hypothetical protein [Bacteroidota bacterium]MBT7464011.1 hypothetical protein [Bacteroidota bacterium]